MKGTIIHYNQTDYTGFISGHNGQRYKFAKINWVDDATLPEADMVVDFDTGDDDNTALDIVIVGEETGAVPASSTRVTSDDIADGLLEFVWRLSWGFIKFCFWGALILGVLFLWAIWYEVG